MNINVVRLLSIGVITGFIVMCEGLWQLCFLNASALILLSLAVTHCRLSDIRYHTYYLICETKNVDLLNSYCFCYLL